MATCQYCLADPRNTPIAAHLPEEQRCPVCGAAYTGPRRDAEYRALLDAGLVDQGDTPPERVVPPERLLGVVDQPGDRPGGRS